MDVDPKFIEFSEEAMRQHYEREAQKDNPRRGITLRWSTYGIDIDATKAEILQQGIPWETIDRFRDCYHEQGHRLRCLLLGCWYGTPAEPLLAHGECYWCGQPKKPDFYSPGIADQLTKD